jgi:hypothetical protein
MKTNQKPKPKTKNQKPKTKNHTRVISKHSNKRVSSVIPH